MTNLGKIFHLAHVSDDFNELNAWYRRVFEPRYFADHKTDMFPTWPVEKRDATLIAIGDTVLEPMSPSRHLEGWESFPVGRFLNRFGRHWHSIAWYTTDTLALYEQLKANQVRFYFNGGGSDGERQPQATDALFTHPKDTAGALELIRGPLDFDPRYLPGWNPLWWADNHPLGIEKLSHVTVVVSDPAKAAGVYVDTLAGRILEKDESQLLQTKSTYALVGTDTIVELAVPLGPDSLAARDLAKNGDVMHAVTWKVADLDKAAAHLASVGVSILARDDETLVADPETTFGGVMRFTTRQFAGDPRH